MAVGIHQDQGESNIPHIHICKEIYYKALAPVIIETDRSVSWQAGDPGDNGIVFILIQQAQDPGRADISVGSPKAGKKTHVPAQTQSGWRNFPSLAVGSGCFVLFRHRTVWMRSTHKREGNLPLLSLLIQILISSRNTLQTTPD